MRTAGLGIEQPRVLGCGDQLEPHTPESAKESRDCEGTEWVSGE